MGSCSRPTLAVEMTNPRLEMALYDDNAVARGERSSGEVMERE